MTPEQLSELIKFGPSEELASGLASLTDADRRKLAKTAVALRKTFTQRDAGPLVTQFHPSARRLKLALMGLAAWGEAQRIRVWHVGASWRDADSDKESLFRILQDRKPDWLPQWVDKELEQAEMADWQFVRRLIRAGLCPKPTSENYILKMARGMYGHEGTLKDRLLDDPELLTDEIWRLFEVSPARETILHGAELMARYVDEAARDNNSWAGVLASLSREGRIDRARLLAASLDALLRNTEARNTTWFSRFHDLLEPTDDERYTLQARYLQLLSHRVAAVVGFALDALAKLERGKKLDVAGFVEAVPPVFSLQPKVQPLAALKMLGRLSSTASDQLVEALAAGLGHPATAVQEAIVAILVKLADRAGAQIAAVLPGQIDQAAPSVQQQLRQLLAAVQPSAQETQAEPTRTATDVIAVARGIPPGARLRESTSSSISWRGQAS